MNQVDVLVGLLKDVLGNPRHHYPAKHQISFDCPWCTQDKGLDSGDGKGNLEINYNKYVYKCWACSDINGSHGPLGKLFYIYGTKSQKKIFNIIAPSEKKPTFFEKKVELKLPEGYTKFSDSNPIFIPHKEAYRYLLSRGISDDIIAKYDVGYTVKGDFAYRIIVPSFDVDGNLNYFVGRSWVPNKMKYKNPVTPKDEIIFNENKIDWNRKIYLVEGVFDSFFLDNPVVMLGKKMSPKLFNSLYDKAKDEIVICVDGDAWSDGLKIYHELNGGRLFNKIKICK